MRGRPGTTDWQTTPGGSGPAEEERLALGLITLHERARDGLTRQLAVLEREREAARDGNVLQLRELAGREAAGTAEVAAVERAIAALERAPAGAEDCAARADLARSRLEHERLRGAVLESNRRTRVLLEGELRATARALVAHRVRAGTPSPFAAIGDAAFLDIRR